MNGDTLPPSADAGAGRESEVSDVLEVYTPPDLKEKLARFGTLACAVSQNPDSLQDSVIADQPSGLLGTDDDRGLYRSGRRLPL